MASDYPTSIDNSPPALRDDVDVFYANGLQHIADMVIAVQGVLGTDLNNFMSSPGFGGSKKIGNLSQTMQALMRMETGSVSVTYNPTNLQTAQAEPITTIDFSTGRFTAPPFVLIQTIEAHQYTGSAGMGSGTPSANGLRESKIFPVRVTKESFGLSVSNKSALIAISSAIPIKCHWLAIEPPFGYADKEVNWTG